jgi:glycosyltransferase involved in cell wall biosynthesis
MTSYRDPRILADEIKAAFGPGIDRHLGADGLDRNAIAIRNGATHIGGHEAKCQMQHDSEVFVSVVVPTVGRQTLRDCVESILASTHANIEVIVVDNAPWNSLTLDLFQSLHADDDRVRYEVEPVSGSSRARNVGLRVANGSIVAFTDDDVVVDPQWLQSLLRGFGRNEAVVAVTGLTVPQRLETAAEVAFELHGGFGRGFQQRLWDLDMHKGVSVLYPYTGLAGASTNNLAVVKDAALSRGGFDERLGPGTPTYASEDADFILSMIVDGHQISYEPSAVVRHAHRAEWEALKWQLFTYSVGRTAMLLKWAVADRKTAFFILAQLPKVFRERLARARRAKSSNGMQATKPFRSRDDPPCFALLEFLGTIYGPVAYLRSFRRRSSSRRQTP